MKFKYLEGVIPPMIVPFDEHGEVDEKALREFTRFLLRSVDGLFILGTYGCGPLLRVEERKRVAEIVVEEVNGKVPVIVHVGSISTKDAVELAKHAQTIGADAISSVPPFYYHHAEEDVFFYFKRLLDAVSIPVYVYNNPKTVGYGVSVNLLKRLADEGVYGVKDSSFDIMVLSDYKRKVNKEGFDVVMGTEALFLPAASLGVRAFIPGLGNAFPELCKELYNVVMSGAPKEKVIEVHNRVMAVRDLMRFANTTTVGAYTMVNLRGIKMYPREPFRPASDEVKEKIKEALKKMGLL